MLLDLDLIPKWLGAVYSGMFGLVLGSFANVVIARLPHGKSVVRPKSSCPDCGAEIRWRDNVPVIGYLLLRGKCRDCQKPISARYPVVELLTALLFVASFLKYGWSLSLVFRDWPFILGLIIVTFIDLDHRIIPDSLSLGGMAYGLATGFMDSRISFLECLVGAAIGFGVFYLFAWLYYRITGRSGLGGGDIKLLGMMGAFLGPFGVFYTILVSSVAGSLVGIGWALGTRRQREKESSGEQPSNMLQLAIPYGPFLVIGGLYYYLMGDFIWLQFTIPT